MEKHSHSCEFIGMLHVPVNTILTASPVRTWQSDLPGTTREDWLLIDLLERDFASTLQATAMRFFPPDETEGLLAELGEQASSFSFFPFLRDRMLTEAGLYCRFSARTLMLENIAAPYFVRNRQPVAIVAVMARLAGELRRTFPDKQFGIQILAFSDDLALAIALRHGFRFVRSESGLFAGLRPEGPTPNQGNLAALYATRNQWQALRPGVEAPQIFVDLRKKHTVFPAGLEQLEVWKENLLFQKVEGAILTGAATGLPVDRTELQELRTAIDAAASAPFPWKTQLLIGSGVSVDNLALCRHYADGVIVGSSLKKQGYWENVLDEKRLEQFMASWHASSKNRPGPSCPIILASSSPRRIELLKKTGIKCRSVSPDAFQEIMTGKPAEQLAMQNAIGKARIVAEQMDSEGLIVGCDTVIVMGETIFGKPGTPEKAFETLRLLSGKTHRVVSGLALIDVRIGREWLDYAVTEVTFREISEDEIRAYIATGEPLDKAGAYAIQEGGQIFVKKREGSESNVIGLPLELLEAGMKCLGIPSKLSLMKDRIPK